MLELVGFEDVLIPMEDGYPEPCLIIDETRLDTREFVHVISVLDEVINSGGCKKIADKLGIVLPDLPKSTIPPNSKTSAQL
jgi:hypothetical protein